MMRIEIASNLQASSIYGDRRAAAAARTDEEKRSANADARTAEVNDSTLGLGPASDKTGSINKAAAHVQSAAPVEDTDDARSSTAEQSLARTEEDLKEFILMLNELSQMSNNRLEFEFDPEEEISVIRVVDRENGEIVRRIPPEKLLAAIDHVFNTLGIVFDQTA